MMNTGMNLMLLFHEPVLMLDNMKAENVDITPTLNLENVIKSWGCTTICPKEKGRTPAVPVVVSLEPRFCITVSRLKERANKRGDITTDIIVIKMI